MGKKLQLAIPIFDKITALDAVGPYDTLQLLPDLEVVFVAHKPGPYADGGSLSLTATASFEDVPHPDIIIVPGGAGVVPLLKDEHFLAWLRKVHKGTLYTTSVCTGSLLLGAAGLLKGLRATTHWGAMDTLANFGAKPTEQRVVQEGKIITAAGVSSGIDMALKLAALISDETSAKALQLFVEYDPQPPFDSGSLAKAGPEVIERANAWRNAMRKRNGVDTTSSS